MILKRMKSITGSSSLTLTEEALRASLRMSLLAITRSLPSQFTLRVSRISLVTLQRENPKLMLWIDHSVRNVMIQPRPRLLLLRCPHSTASQFHLSPALLSTYIPRAPKVKAIQYRWIFRTLTYPNQTHPHLRVNQQLSDHQPGKTLLRLSIPRKISQTKLQLMELSRLRKPSLQRTIDSHQSRTRVLPGHLNASLKVQSSTIIFCLVKLYINPNCLQNLPLLQKLS